MVPISPLMVNIFDSIVSAICVGLGVSTGNIIFEIYFKDHFHEWKRKRKQRIAKLKRMHLLKYKRPWLAALLNFFVWGLGYFYTARKIFIGILLILVQIFVTGAASFQMLDVKTGFETATYTFLILIISAFLAYDAFKLAKEHNKDLERKKAVKKK
jgi:hypothetical protein